MSTVTEYEKLANGLIYLTTVKVTRGSLVKAISKGQKSKNPVAPESVSAFVRNGEITIKMTVFIDANATINSLNIYTGLGYSSVKSNKIITTKPIYVIYDYLEEIPESLYPYTFSFTMSDQDNSINEIISYLYDKDPVTSRGTTTTVKKGM